MEDVFQDKDALGTTNVKIMETGEDGKLYAPHCPQARPPSTQNR